MMATGCAFSVASTTTPVFPITREAAGTQPCASQEYTPGCRAQDHGPTWDWRVDGARQGQSSRGDRRTAGPNLLNPSPPAGALSQPATDRMGVVRRQTQGYDADRVSGGQRNRRPWVAKQDGIPPAHSTSASGPGIRCGAAKSSLRRVQLGGRNELGSRMALPAGPRPSPLGRGLGVADYQLSGAGSASVDCGKAQCLKGRAGLRGHVAPQLDRAVPVCCGMGGHRRRLPPPAEPAR